jgi:hypothetical protein
LINVVSEIEYKSSQFSSYGQKAIAEAKKNDGLIEFAKNYPSPRERKILLAEGTTAKNKEIWARYIFREAYGITGKDLGPEWIKFQERVKGKNIKPIRSVSSSKKNISELVKSIPLSNEKFIEGCETLLWLFSNGHISRKTFCNAINAII